MDISGEERCRPPARRMATEDVHGFAVEEGYQACSQDAESPFARRVLQALATEAGGIPAKVVAKILGCCHATVCRCIHMWNECGPEGTKGRRGGGVGRPTDDMLKDIDDVMRHRSPQDQQRYQESGWTCKLLALYICGVHKVD